MSGAFQTSRDIFSSPIWKNIVDFRLFFLIYGSAVFSEDGVRLAEDLTLKRGEWCRSTRKIQEDLQYIENRQIKMYSTSVVNRCIKRLVDMQMICTRTHQLGTVFTVVNYEQYQVLSNYKKDNLERNLEHSGNSGGTLGEHSGNNNKNVKNVNNEKKVRSKTYTPEFLEFWSVYPRPIEKADAFKTWEKIMKNGETPSVVIQCAANYAQYCEIKQTPAEYIKHPKTFLNEERYKEFLVFVLPQKPKTTMDILKEKLKEAQEQEAKRDGENGNHSTDISVFG